MVSLHSPCCHTRCKVDHLTVGVGIVSSPCWPGRLTLAQTNLTTTSTNPYSDCTHAETPQHAPLSARCLNPAVRPHDAKQPRRVHTTGVAALFWNTRHGRADHTHCPAPCPGIFQTHRALRTTMEGRQLPHLWLLQSLRKLGYPRRQPPAAQSMTRARNSHTPPPPSQQHAAALLKLQPSACFAAQPPTEPPKPIPHI